MLPRHHDPGVGHLMPGYAFGPVHHLGPRWVFLFRKSGRLDSNRRSQAPRACGLARLSHALFGRRRSSDGGEDPLARRQTTRPGVFVTPGPRLRARDVRGRASRPQGIERERARRLTGGSLRFHTAQGVTRTPGEHGRPRCNGCLRPTRRVTELTARPVVLYPYRRGSPRGCSRDSGGLLGLAGAAARCLRAGSP